MAHPTRVGATDWNQPLKFLVECPDTALGAAYASLCVACIGRVADTKFVWEPFMKPLVDQVRPARFAAVVMMLGSPCLKTIIAGAAAGWSIEQPHRECIVQTLAVQNSRPLLLPSPQLKAFPPSLLTAENFFVLLRDFARLGPTQVCGRVYRSSWLDDAGFSALRHSACLLFTMRVLRSLPTFAS